MAVVEICLQVAITNKSAARDFESAIDSLASMCADNPHDIELRQVLLKLQRAAKSIVVVNTSELNLPR